ncbi:hypothetical protein HUJ04_011324 [Dendroctonus ponderosae]|nr:hypothetical protein HUJ04_011324 [Dendroctonus ponderosae]
MTHKIWDSSEFLLMASLNKTARKIFERMLKGPSTQKYDPAVRSFALTLAFYSPRACEFVRTTFSKSLPHLSTITKWYASVDGTPGLTTEALVELKLKSGDASKPLMCNLVMGEMYIRKMVEWNGRRYTGFVNVGTGIESKELPEAKEVLVFMLVCLLQAWKIPIAYFLTKGTTGSEKVDLLYKCLHFISESGVVVTSVTFDGASSNIKMCKELGVALNDPRNLKPFFFNPITNDKICIFMTPVTG